MERSSTMKAIEFESFKIKESKNNQVLISTSFKILDDDDNPVKNSILVSKILDELEDIELKTDEKGFTSLSFYKQKSECQTKPEIDLIQFYTQQSINSNLIMKEVIKKESVKLQNFPLGTADFETIRNKNKLYIDKTKQIYDLIQTSKSCFISRPRRFGKSLIISTLENLFKGKKDLFKGLDIEKENYSFEKHPVIRLDFSRLKYVDSGQSFNKAMLKQLYKIASKEKVSLKEETQSEAFEELIELLVKKTGNKVVILIDEYDKPILDNITKINIDDIQEELKNFFGVTKTSDNDIEFLFITGITKLSNINMFSDANHIDDMSTDRLFDSMFGYTQEELEDRFNPYIKSLAKEEGLSFEEILLKIKEYYNGYTFSKEERAIYNPFSILHLFSENSFNNYWFESGTPTFVLELMKEKGFDISDKNALTYGEDLFDKVKASELTIKNVLFQAGYLTIKKNKEGEKELVFPNTEIQDSFYRYFITFFAKKGINYSVHLKNIKKAFINKDSKQIQEVLNNYFSEFTYETTGSEKLYHSLIFALLNLTGFKVISEVLTKKGRIDQYLENEDDIYIIEYKYKASSKKAMEQIIDRRYFQKYLNTDKNIHLLGINFEKDGEIKDDILVVNPRNKEELEKFINRK